METILTALGWIAAAVLAEIALSSLARIVMVRTRRWSRKTWILDSYWLTPLLYGGTCSAVLILLGAVKPLTGGLLAGLLFGAAAVMLGDTLLRGIRQGKGRMAARRILRALRTQATGGFAYLRDDMRMLLALRQGPRPQRGGSRPVAAAPARPADGTVRSVPSLRDDPALGDRPQPVDAASVVPAPAPWAELAAWLAGVEPEDDNEQSKHIHGIAAGLAAVAEGLRTHAEVVTENVGLDPSYGGAILELADLIAEIASDAAMVDRRYHLIYDAVKNAVADGLILPYNARQWFNDDTGTGSAA